ncbi:hypothetical protein GA0116948_103157 [Chitinophaga costaii]|uniref:Uncharacterized protein n=1 Tax=Chitinophaga costaii TaxID=1335309 RepID=A0A1C4BLJ3_9BACT|nr:hypothetical protein GA0116948_103157 [Chitinophaga costaii]
MKRNMIDQLSYLFIFFSGYANECKPAFAADLPFSKPNI